ncbi:MAG: translation initiation factor eIF-1A [Candidatus Aenigmarchaeota archaeon]|nr:translation initiation factor eIF-1A [Candidatus Aenigmarchaeota archaeon]MCX8190877.1 translation initiation factor eIF-1A [Candidatus Aenigmarchaeota archaeon]MDW8159879.1 translation initiation factor eIF-1A [Candidatus Aenigmarchaeota archaeon]
MTKRYEPTEEELEISRIRLPREGEVLGIVDSMLGGDRMKVICDDNKERICRIPGKLRKRVWIRERDLVLIEPWKIQGDKRGDVIFRYTPTQANWLKKNGYIKNLQI